MSYEMLAFYTGILSSFHCVLMCGPLVLSFPFSKQSAWGSIGQIALYQAGRILMYGTLGLVAGYLGGGLNLLGLQQILAFFTGFFLISLALRYFLRIEIRPNRLTAKWLKILTATWRKQLTGLYGSFFAGAINGLLPCGIVYLALAGAINLHSPYDAAKFMLFFGMGTSPLLLIALAMPMLFRRIKMPAGLVPILFLVAGLFLISRGLNLEIPYISHHVKGKATEICK